MLTSAAENSAYLLVICKHNKQTRSRDHHPPGPSRAGPGRATLLAHIVRSGVDATEFGRISVSHTSDVKVENMAEPWPKDGLKVLGVAKAERGAPSL